MEIFKKLIDSNKLKVYNKYKELQIYSVIFLLGVGSTLGYKMIEEHIQQQKKVSIKEPFYKKLNIWDFEFKSEVLPHLKTSQEIINEAQDKYLHIKVEEIKKKKHKNKLKVSRENEEKRYEQKTKKKPEEQAQVFSMVATAYISFCDTGCIGTTKTGYDVSNTIYYRGKRVIAVDPSLIPLNSLVRVSYGSNSFEAYAIDTGGDIKGNRIDVLVGTESIAKDFGRKNVKVTVLKKGR
ncbi:3D domain-containing protein [Bacillus paralicheniformis]|uniref:3D domain-containing protein n=1 Tax=Bacillus paralicheniformis TaxID=1648923 RepID=UPI0021A6B833|nr:3D domain-containing protein [Bacillus paralicheniformis]UWS63416.1 3D domain-containing protein [Bacillus paralicheniformis]